MKLITQEILVSTWSISLSHSAEYAVAFVVAVGKKIKS